MTRSTKILWTVSLLTTAIVAVVWFATVVLNHKRAVRKYDLRYSQIKVGDSKSVVIALMGNPTRVADCSYAAFPEQKMEADYKARCKEQFRYEVLLKDYIISVDRDGAVLGKNTAVSP